MSTAMGISIILFFVLPILVLGTGLTVFLVYHFSKKRRLSAAQAPAAAFSSASASPATKTDVRRPLSQIIKEHRVRCGMTQEFVAQSLGVTRQAVSKWESGTSDPSTGNLLELARLFGVPAEELLNGAEPC